MADPQFFNPPKPATLEAIAAWCGGRLVDDSRAGLTVTGVAPLDTAGAGDLAFIDNRKYLGQLAGTHATACLVAPRHLRQVPASVAAIETAEPYRAFATILGKLYPAALRLAGAYGGEAGATAPSARVHPSAVIEPGATLEPGVVVGARAEIGTGTVIGANSVIGHDVRIGRNGHVAANVTILHALIGNRVIIHAGVRIGQDGFGFAMGPRGHQKVPQVGRVVIQDDVEIGANSTIDRGATRDTVIGEGTKIDNLVQVAHNVVVGRHCVLVAQCGIGGSTTLGDFVVVAGQVGIAGHVEIGTGVMIAAQSGVTRSLQAGGRFGGTPARTMSQWAHETAAVRLLARRRGSAAASVLESDEGQP